ncbi:transposase family protein [Marinobacter sp. NFXS11]|uniref:hypothetical protein n=1 Tax=Marinobacter sp. NFXS11 TaxID=2818432 RepID=UPI0032DF9200
MQNFLRLGSNIVYENRKATIASEASNAFLLRFKGGETESVPKCAIQTAVNQGRLVPDLDPPGSDSTGLPFLSEKQVREIERKFAYIKPLLDVEFPNSEKERRRVIEIVAKQRGDSLAKSEKDETSREKAPSLSQIRRWRQRFEESGRNPLSLVRKHEHRKRTSKVAEVYLELMDEMIDEHYMCRNHMSITGAYAQFYARCLSRNYDPKTIPTYETFRKRVKTIHPLEVLQSQEGAAAARMAGRTVNGVYMPRRPLERVELDAVHLNLGLLNEKGDYIGMVVLFIAIDVYTRCVLGYSYKVKPKPSEDGETAIECLKMAMRFKPKNSFPFQLVNEWEMSGKIDTVVVDPGTALIAKSMTMFLGGLGVHRETTASRSPWRKPFIERFFRTLRGELMELLPGYARKRTEKYLVDYKLPKDACMTVQEFEYCLTRYIVDVYHQAQHRGLGGKTPHEAWLEGIQDHGAPELVHNMDFLMNFAANQLTYAATVKDGVGIKEVKYNSRELQDLILRLQKPNGKCRVDLLRCTHDISKIQVYDPFEKKYIVVPSKFPALREGTSEEEYMAGKKKVSYGPRVNVINNNNPVIAGAKDRQKKRKADKKVRNQPAPSGLKTLSTMELNAQLNEANIDLNPKAAEMTEVYQQSTVSAPEAETSSKPKKSGKKRFKTWSAS